MDGLHGCARRVNIGYDVGEVRDRDAWSVAVRCDVRLSLDLVEKQYEPQFVGNSSVDVLVNRSDWGGGIDYLYQETEFV